MRSPYLKTSFKRLKRKSPIRYLLTGIVYFPAYLASLLGALFRSSVAIKVGRLLGKLTLPIKAPFDLLKCWVLTRKWKEVLFAAPILLLAVACLSVVFINKNRQKGSSSKGQRRAAQEALVEGDYDTANLIYGKLIQQDNFKNDPDILHYAMIAARYHGNASRFSSLKKRLVGEFNHIPARLWLSELVLRNGSRDTKMIQEAIGHLDAVISNKEYTASKDRQIESLASLYKQQRRLSLARDYYEKVDDLSPYAALSLIEVYQALGNLTKAESVSREVLAKLDDIDPAGVEFLRVRVACYINLVNANALMVEQMRLLENTNTLIQNWSNHHGDSLENRRILSWSYYTLARAYLSMSDEAMSMEGMVCLSKSVTSGVVNDQAGFLLLLSCNPVGDQSISNEAINKMLVEGKAPLICHLKLGLDAWRLNNVSLAKFHFEVASHIDPIAFDCLRSVAENLAKLGEETIVSSVRFYLGNKSPWATALELLTVLAEVEGTESSGNLLARSSIYAARYRWRDVVAMLEPNLASFDRTLKPRVLMLLRGANYEMRNFSKAKYYEGLYNQSVKSLELEGNTME